MAAVLCAHVTVVVEAALIAVEDREAVSDAELAAEGACEDVVHAPGVPGAPLLGESAQMKSPAVPRASTARSP
jgi:hypothetical protein